MVWNETVKRLRTETHYKYFDQIGTRIQYKHPQNSRSCKCECEKCINYVIVCVKCIIMKNTQRMFTVNWTKVWPNFFSVCLQISNILTLLSFQFWARSIWWIRICFESARVTRRAVGTEMIAVIVNRYVNWTMFFANGLGKSTCTQYRRISE